MDVARQVQTGTTQVHKDLLQLLSATADACQAALTKATSAAEPQGLIQAYARLQQLQGKAATVPAGAPASMAVTSKVLGLIEGLSAATPGTAGASYMSGSAGMVAAAGATGGAVAAAAKPMSAAAKPRDKIITSNAQRANSAEQVGSKSPSKALLAARLPSSVSRMRCPAQQELMPCCTSRASRTAGTATASTLL